MIRLEQKSKSQLPTQSGCSEKTKISTTGAYSSSSNLETSLAEETGVDSPVCPQGSKKSKRVDVTGRKGLSPLQKCSAVIRMLAYGVAADAVDDYVHIDESTTIECLKNFVEDRDFSGMLGSIDCMHWQWKNRPKTWKGMYMSGYRGVATIVLEVITSSDFWIWHAFFGDSGSNNDINVLDRSQVFDDILNDHTLEMVFILNEPHLSNQSQSYRERNASYLHNIKKGKEKIWSEHSECCKMKLANTMRACIILHNMIGEDERNTYAGNFVQGLEYDDVENGLSQPQLGEEDFAPYHQFFQRNA
ncbi:uncharacterized protein LOC130949092 [Arachis stenosperma]|uniref:uncharacterized protein LOC130949092 n=1 Tax=Arachis stenosperma TaxID=217475 RepID=UPI0025ABBA89|nr:uncharacterized protein LOC130949092 [Arachis stenosperma]